MKQKKKKLLQLPIIFFLACAALAVFLFQFETRRQEDHALIRQNKESPEFFLDQAVTTRYDREQGIKHQLIGEHLEYFKSEDVIQVTRPYFILHSKDGHHWHTRADRATITEDKKSILLEGNVRSWQPNRNLELTTESLYLVPDREYGETAKAVTIKSVAGVTQGIGMEADLRAETLKLHADVKGTYVPR